MGLHQHVAPLIKYTLVALYINVILIYICYHLLKLWFSSYDKFNTMIKLGHPCDISNTELSNLGYWTKYSNTNGDPYAFNNASNNLEKYMLGKLNTSAVQADTSAAQADTSAYAVGADTSKLLIINPSLDMIKNTTYNAYYLFTSIDRYSDMDNGLNVSILNLDGTMPYKDGCIDKIINIETIMICDREKLIKECYRVLSKTGTLVFSTLDISSKYKAYPIGLFYGIPVKNLIGIDQTMESICNELTGLLSYTTEDITEYSLISLLNYLYNSNKYTSSINVTKYMQYVLNIQYLIVTCRKN